MKNCITAFIFAFISGMLMGSLVVAIIWSSPISQVPVATKAEPVSVNLEVAEPGIISSGPAVPESAVQHRAKLRDLQVGETGCTFLGWSASKERHIWLREAEELATYTCDRPDGRSARITRTKTGYAVVLLSPIGLSDSADSYMKEIPGYVKAETVTVVK